MYESFYELSGKPFSLLPDADFLFFSKKHKRVITLLEYAHTTQAGFIVISGDVGAGKTTALQYYMRRLGREVTTGVITNSSRTFGPPLRWVTAAFGLPCQGKDDVNMYNEFVHFLNDQYAQNRRTVLIIDEAQNLTADMLEDLRMLSNVNTQKEPLLQIILAGQPQLLATMKQPELQQLAQRVAVHCHLSPLEPQETLAYIRHRLSVVGGDGDIFDDTACAAVHFFTDGVPRLINLLCDYSLLYAFAEDKKQISFPVVIEVVLERDNAGLTTFRNVVRGQTETDLFNQFMHILNAMRVAA